MRQREWLKEGLCVSCKHKETCDKPQPGLVIGVCGNYERKSK